ncbi:hypothetical protein ACEPAI_4189 [Sanghuangporus weigelae]
MATIASKLLIFFWAFSTFGSLLSVAQCIEPSIRREWRQISTEEKSAWISAVKCLTTFPHTDSLAPSVDPSLSQIPPVNTSSTYYDDFVYMHMDLNIRIHSTGYFLPFHRWYVAVYEQDLKEKCNYMGVSPYWNWSIDSTDVFDSDFFKDSDPTSGLGGWGDPSKDFSVTDGAFSDFMVAYPNPHILRRNFSVQPWSYVGDLNGFNTYPETYANATFTPDVISAMINGYIGDYVGFQADFEKAQGAHAAVHLMMEGDLGGTCPQGAYAGCPAGNSPTWSANEPLFWMHHAMVDKVWYDWQNANPENFWAFFGGATSALQNVSYADMYPNGGPPFLSINDTIPADGLFNETTIYNVMNTTGGYLCYVYE